MASVHDCKDVLGLSFSSEGVPNLQKLVSIKLQPPILATNFMKFYSPIHLTPKHAKIVMKSVFLNKINTRS